MDYLRWNEKIAKHFFNPNNHVVWKQLAENCCKYLKKGSKVYLEGRIQTEKYEKDGQERYFTKIIANQVKFLDSRTNNENQGKTPVTNPNDVNASRYPDGDIPF